MILLRAKDKVDILGFGYAPIFATFMGNLTFSNPPAFGNPDYRYFILYLKRFVYIHDSEHPYYYTVLRVSNDFGKLHLAMVHLV